MPIKALRRKLQTMKKPEPQNQTGEIAAEAVLEQERDQREQRLYSSFDDNASINSAPANQLGFKPQRRTSKTGRVMQALQQDQSQRSRLSSDEDGATIKSAPCFASSFYKPPSTGFSESNEVNEFSRRRRSSFHGSTVSSVANSRRQTRVAHADFDSFLGGLSILDPDKTNDVQNLLLEMDDFDFESS